MDVGTPIYRMQNLTTHGLMTPENFASNWGSGKMLMFYLCINYERCSNVQGKPYFGHIDATRTAVSQQLN